MSHQGWEKFPAFQAKAFASASPMLCLIVKTKEGEKMKERAVSASVLQDGCAGRL